MKPNAPPPRRKLSAVLTLTSYVWVTVAPTVAYAQDAAESEPVQMLPLSDCGDIDGRGIDRCGGVYASIALLDPCGGGDLISRGEKQP
jgi:hypothetical protein